MTSWVVCCESSLAFSSFSSVFVGFFRLRAFLVGRSLIFRSTSTRFWCGMSAGSADEVAGALAQEAL